MSEDRPGTYRDDYELKRRCEVAVWFELVDRRVQQGGDRADDKVIKAESKQAVALNKGAAYSRSRRA